MPEADVPLAARDTAPGYSRAFRDVIPGAADGEFAYDGARSMAAILASVPRKVSVIDGLFVYELLADLLHAMWDDDLLSAEMHGAAVDLRTAFKNSHIDFSWLREADASDVAVIFGHPRTEFREVACRELVAMTLNCAGGILSPAGQALWYVICWGCPLRTFAEVHGYSEDIATGILIGALSAIGPHLRNPKTATIPARAVAAAAVALGVDLETFKHRP
ncbi:MAG TPA: hypothetical protein VHW66_19060 [Stellaceae bacterium]|nr:hypothetical protein [Stellaceae bacterium]